MYGLLRTHKETALSLKKHVLDVNDADLFIFSPNKAGGLSIPEGVDINLYKSENKKNSVIDNHWNIFCIRIFL